MKVVVINGWSAPSVIWRTFLEDLRQRLSLQGAKQREGEPLAGGASGAISVELLSIDQAESLDGWLERLDSRLDSDTVLIGWSLGGAIAAHLIADKGLRVKGYVSLMSNPAFVSGAACNWAMARTEFESFQGSLSKDPEAALRVFRALLVQGEANGRTVLRDLAEAYRNNAFEPMVLAHTLEMLGELSVVDLWNKIRFPALFIWAELDALSRCPDSAYLAELSSRHSNLQFEVLPQASHLPMYSSAKMLSSLISDFVMGLGGSRA